MAQTRKLSESVHVAPQLVEADFAEIANAGFKAIVCNRPDGEDDVQLSSGRAQELARMYGLEFRYQPVVGFDVTEDDAVDMFDRLASELPGPVLFYCRSGTRCTILWAQANAPRLGAQTVIETARLAGYDISTVADVIEERAQVGAIDDLPAETIAA